MSLSAYVTIIRPANAVISGITAIIAYLIASGTNIFSALALFVIVTVICGAGNVLNDYFDRDIDAINRPDRPIPSGALSPRNAAVWAGVLFAVGILVSFATNFWCLAIAVVNTILLIAYAAKLKKMPLLGNLSVAYLSGSIFLFGGVLVGPESFIVTLPLFAITFFGTLAREILKAAEDIEGDAAGGARTLPMILGVQKSGYVSVILIACAICASVVPYSRWGALYLAAIAVIDLFILYAAAKSVRCKTPAELIAARSTSLIKYGMFAALFLFLVMELWYGIISPLF
ncbi:geranylgeranylglycerol-phosphate geranylgeranyltransferase [Methanorbis furvi]|uniref:Digeranylgeranylglyceryl phosphate synthase n=1 Tax=Methanorbis furvi TaxID=3028299 RepID=A0AAE4S9R7_9EURY|nr:Protoheme IX farnesyltransferase [Methanocorpusculaceae archaeon Ag1]